MADFRDPWTEIFYFKHLELSGWAYRRHRSLEQSVLDAADVVTVVSRKMQEGFAARTSTPVKIVTNGFDHADFECAAGSDRNIPDIDVGKRMFSLVHTGIFVDNGNPDHLWEVLGEKAADNPQFRDNLQIRLMGQVDASVLQGIEKAGLESNLINMGYRPHTEVVLWQQMAQVLLLPLRKEPEAAAILTGKFFEYLASGREILAFGPVDGDLAKALQETGSGSIVNFNDKEATRREIDRLYEDFLAGKGKDYNGRNPLSDTVMRYSREYLTGEMTKLF